MIGRVVLDGGCEVLRGGVVVARGEVLVAGVLGLERVEFRPDLLPQPSVFFDGARHVLLRARAR